MTSSFVLRDIFRDHCVVSLPTKSDFRGIKYREAFLFQGPHGWSEFSPFLEYDDAEASAWLIAAIEGAYKPWPALQRSSIPINATLPRIPADQVADFLRNYPGCTTIKMKVNDFESDADRLDAVLEAVPDAHIRLDVNGAWSLKQARTYIHNYFMHFGKVFEYIEQPCSDLADLAALKSEIPIKLAVDESIRKFLKSDFTSLKECADVAIIKWAPSGGLSNSQALIKHIGLPTVISSAVDTGIGISHGLALAATLPELPYACGLGTTALLVSDVVSPRPTPHDGALPVLRPTLNQELVEKNSASPVRWEWWENRVSRIWNSYISEEVKSWVQS